jgi:hypothetical protein
MSKTVTVPLGGVDYKVPMLNLDQLERMASLLTSPTPQGAFAVLKIGLERAQPAVENPSQIEATLQEVNHAMKELMLLSGFRSDDAPNGAAPVRPGHHKS